MAVDKKRKETELQEDVVLSKAEFETFVSEKKFVEYHSDLHVHSKIQERHGLTHEDMQQVLSQGTLKASDFCSAVRFHVDGVSARTKRVNKVI